MNPPTRHQGRSPILGLAAGLLVTLTLGMPVRAAVPARVAAALAEVTR